MISIQYWYSRIRNNQKGGLQRNLQYQSHLQLIDMTEPSYEEYTPEFLLSLNVNHRGLSATDYMAAHYLNGQPESAFRTDTYLDISQYCAVQYDPALLASTSMDIEAEVPVSQSTIEPNLSVEANEFLDTDDHAQQSLASTRGRRGQRQRTGSPKRDYNKNITKTAVHSCCRDFQRDILAQKVVKKKCATANTPYSNFVTLLKQILKEYHISNEILLKTYLVPSKSDPQFAEKCIFAEYFSYFLNNSFTQLAEKAKVKDLKAYISYSRRFLAYLGAQCVVPEISQNNRI